MRFENIQKKIFEAVQQESELRTAFASIAKSSAFSEEDELLEKERRNAFKNEMFKHKVKRRFNSKCNDLAVLGDHWPDDLPEDGQ